MTQGKNTRIFILAVFFAVAAFFSVLVSVSAETNISATSTEHSAWEDINGWWDFYNTNSLYVWGSKVVGYASSSAGVISFDCATTPLGNICASSNYGTCNGPGPHGADGTCSNADASGILTGYAWNDEIGWISLNCDASTHGGSNNCAISNYKVQIDGNGDFSGYAWNDIVGWISFNCANNSSCDTSNFKVNTSWRATSTTGYVISSVFDTENAEGGLLQSITWQGNEPNGTCVSFQISVSQNSDGPWNYLGPSGDDSTYYGAACDTAPNGGIGCAPNDTAICINKNDFIDYRYMRYKVKLDSNLLQTETPRIDDIILNWNP